MATWLSCFCRLLARAKLIQNLYKAFRQSDHKSWALLHCTCMWSCSYLVLICTYLGKGHRIAYDLSSSCHTNLEFAQSIPTEFHRLLESRLRHMRFNSRGDYFAKIKVSIVLIQRSDSAQVYHHTNKTSESAKTVTALQCCPFARTQVFLLGSKCWTLPTLLKINAYGCDLD